MVKICWSGFLIFPLYFYFRTVYHCPFCNLCRVGKGLGIDFFHCMTCNCCLGITLVDHKCCEKSLEINCPICCDFLFTSSATVRALPCGHFMHSACFQVYILFPSCFDFCTEFMFQLFLLLYKEIDFCRCLMLYSTSFIISGIHLQSLCLPNLQQIFGKYGGKWTIF